jgi:hypothetical protein
MDVPLGLVFKGSAGLLILAAFSLMPFHDDWKFSLTPSCTHSGAKACKGLFLTCRGLMLSFNPATGAPKSDPGALVAAQQCFKGQYEPACAASCGYPVDTGSWWTRFQRHGPWYLKFLPGASSYWRKVATGDHADEITF